MKYGMLTACLLLVFAAVGCGSGGTPEYSEDDMKEMRKQQEQISAELAKDYQ